MNIQTIWPTLKVAFQPPWDLIPPPLWAPGRHLRGFGMDPTLARPPKRPRGRRAEVLRSLSGPGAPVGPKALHGAFCHWVETRALGPLCCTGPLWCTPERLLVRVEVVFSGGWWVGWPNGVGECSYVLL